MAISNMNFNFIVKSGDKLAKSILCSKPQNTFNTKGLKLAPALKKDTVQFTSKAFEEINTKADELLKKVRNFYHADYIETNFPEVIENVAQGKIGVQDELNYWRYKTIEALRKENPEAFLFVGNGSHLNLFQMVNSYGDTVVKIIKNKPIEQLKQTYSEVDKVFKKPTFEHYMNMLILKEHNPEVYQYAMAKNPNAIRVISSWSKTGLTPSTKMLRNITPEQMQVMENDRIPYTIRHLGEYIENSDAFTKNTNAVKELSEDFSKCKLSTDVVLHRGEKTVGMFDEIGLDKDFEQKTRLLLEQNKDKALNTKITEYTGRYMVEPYTNLYDFLSSKKTLSLADAMQMAKYGDEHFVKELLSKIQSSKLTDTRFKSLSFDEGMARGWKNLNRGDNTTIFQRATVAKGTQGGYHEGINAQYEVILNNTPKETTVKNATYDRENDTFELETFIQNL